MNSTRTDPRDRLTFESRLIPATLQQEGIWFHAQLSGTSYWNFVQTRSYRGILQVSSLASALVTIVGRHSSLRTNFRVFDDRLLQIVGEVAAKGDILECIRCGAAEPVEKIARVQEAIERYQRYEFDWENEALLKLKVLQFEDDNIFLLAVSHIVIDAISLHLFWKDLAACYNSLMDGGSGELLMPVRQYAEYALEQFRFLSSESCHAQTRYWLSRMSAEAPVLDLPFYKNRVKSRLYSVSKELPFELADAVRSFTLKKRLLHSSVFLAAYFLVLHKYSGKDRILIGNIINGRSEISNDRNDKVIGTFANTLLCLQEVRAEITLQEFLTKVNAELLTGFDNATVPYEHWVRKYPGRSKDLSRPLFQAVFNVIKSLEEGEVFDGLRQQLPLAEYQGHVAQENAYDVNFFVIQDAEKVCLHLTLRADDQWQSMADLVLDSYLHFLHLLIERPALAIGDLDRLTMREQRMLASFNDTAQELPAMALVHEQFRRQASATPHRTALIYANQEISYRELDQASDRLAALLAGMGIGKEKRVGILLGRSVRILESLLAVLKTGAAYLPLDPEYPVQRLHYMMQDAKVDLLLTETHLRKILPPAVRVFFLDEVKENLPPETMRLRSGDPEDMAYMIYTSGSTGEPKGVVIRHRSVVNFIEGMTRQIDFSSRRVYALSTIGFDVFVLESFLSLCAGATVVLATEEEQKNPGRSVEAIQAHRIQMLQGTPTRIKMLLKEDPAFLSTLTHIFVGGENFPADLVQRLAPVYTGKLYNLYGPTETTVWCTVCDMTGRSYVTAGKPIDNVCIHILDEKGRRQGVGILGEVGISGVGVADGYWAKPALTSERFIVDVPVPGTRTYRTGDIGRWTPGGELDLIGRNDGQVKVRGYRVELDDIAIQMKSHPAVKDAVVICIRESDYSDLYAYYISDQPLEVRALRTHLRNLLPEYMLPSYFIHMHSFPQTPTGKIDRLALKEVKGVLEIGKLADHKHIDGRLLALWIGILQVDNEAFNERSFDHFFESGGHSLKVLQLLDSVQNEFGVTISMREFFKTPTIQFLQEKVIIKT